MPIDNKQSDGTDVPRLEDCVEQEFDLSKMQVVVSPTSGFFGKWAGIPDEDKIRLNALVRQEMQKNHEDSIRFAGHCDSGWLDWVILRA